MWMTHPNFKESLKNWWRNSVEGMTLFRVQKKLKDVKIKLNKWNKEVFGNLEVRKKGIEGEMDEIEHDIFRNGRNQELDRKENEVMVDYYNFITQEDMH